VISGPTGAASALLSFGSLHYCTPFSRVKGGMPDTSVHRHVRDLKRKHEEEAVLRNDGEEHGSSTIFWSKKIENDLKHNKAVRVDDEALRREREAELERVRARRCWSILSLITFAVRLTRHTLKLHLFHRLKFVVPRSRVRIVAGPAFPALFSHNTQSQHTCHSDPMRPLYDYLYAQTPLISILSVQL
jgi:hypothetical protein